MPERYNSHSDLFLKGIYAENYIAVLLRIGTTSLKFIVNILEISCAIEYLRENWIPTTLLFQSWLNSPKIHCFYKKHCHWSLDFIRTCVADKLTSPIVTSPAWQQNLLQIPAPAKKNQNKTQHQPQAYCPTNCISVQKNILQVMQSKLEVTY